MGPKMCHLFIFFVKSILRNAYNIWSVVAFRGKLIKNEVIKFMMAWGILKIVIS